MRKEQITDSETAEFGGEGPVQSVTGTMVSGAAVEGSAPTWSAKLVDGGSRAVPATLAPAAGLTQCGQMCSPV